MKSSKPTCEVFRYSGKWRWRVRAKHNYYIAESFGGFSAPSGAIRSFRKLLLLLRSEDPEVLVDDEGL